MAWLEGLGWGWIHGRVREAQAATRAALSAIAGVEVLTPAGRAGRPGDVHRRRAGPRRGGGGAGRDGRRGALSAPSRGAPGVGRLLHRRGRRGASGGGRRGGVLLLASEDVSQDRLVIRGGRALSGTIVPSGNKNAALPILAACLLTDEEVVLDNVPDILDVHVMLALLDDLGVSVRDEGPNSLALRADRVRTTHLDPDLCRRLRASLLLAGPLLARCGRGGAAPGRRRLHRPAPRRHPPARLPRPRRRVRGQPQLQAAATPGSAARTSSSTRRRSPRPRTR